MNQLANIHSLRAAAIDDNTRQNRLREMMHPMVEAWMSPDLQGLLGDFDTFRSWLGLDQACALFIQNNASAIDDWSSVIIDANAMNLKNSVTNRLQVRLCATLRILI